jgi:hypothetical protein
MGLIQKVKQEVEMGLRLRGCWIVGCGLAAITWLPARPAILRADPLDSSSSSESTAPKTPQDLKAAALAKAHARTAVKQSITALAKEYEAHQKDPTVPLREKSNYFKDNPAPEITTDAILYALEQSDGPAAEACYIKWQLLSGMPPKADDKLAPRIGELYANAPGPIPNPSLTSTDKAQLDSQITRMTQDQESMVDDVWNKHMAAWTDANAPILNYNDALFEMLPEGLGATTLGLQDAYQRRATAGVGCDVFINEVLTEARDWAVTATPDQLGAARDLITGCMNLYTKTFPPSVYASVDWDDKSHALHWTPKPVACVTVQVLTDFRKFLIDQASQPGGGIKIKPAN